MEEIYMQNAKLVYGFLLSKCGDSNVAEELTQETLPLSDVDWELSDQTDLEKLVIARMELAEVKAGIRELPENMRKVLFFRASLNMPFREIGEIMGKSENWARVTFFRAKEILKDRRMSDE